MANINHDKQLGLFDDAMPILDAADNDVPDNKETARVLSVDKILVVSYCDVCKASQIIVSPMIHTEQSMLQFGWEKISDNHYLVGGTCSRSCEQKLAKQIKKVNHAKRVLQAK